MNIIVMGPPGAGKGTIGEMIGEHYKIPLISTGDILRKVVEDKTEIGLKVKEYMDRGDYVPDDIVMRMLKERLAQDDCKNGFILDGYPRTMAQVKSLEDADVNIDVVLNFQADKDIIVNRLSTRLTCKSCSAIYNIVNVPPKKEGVCDRCGGELYQRDDQKPEAIAERIRVYESQTAPLIDYYRNEGLLKDIDANPRQPREIFENALRVLESGS